MCKRTQFVEEAERLLGTADTENPDYSFMLISRRARHNVNTWLNETAGEGKEAMGQHVEMNVKDAEQLGIRDNDRVVITSNASSVQLHVKISERPRRGVLVAYHCWGSGVYDPSTGKLVTRPGININNALLSNRIVDPVSQTAPLNGVRVHVEPRSSQSGVVKRCVKK